MKDHPELEVNHNFSSQNLGYIFGYSSAMDQISDGSLTLLNAGYFYNYLTRGGEQSSPPQIEPKIMV